MRLESCRRRIPLHAIYNGNCSSGKLKTTKKGRKSNLSSLCTPQTGRSRLPQGHCDNNCRLSRDELCVTVQRGRPLPDAWYVGPEQVPRLLYLSSDTHCTCVHSCPIQHLAHFRRLLPIRDGARTHTYVCQIPLHLM